MKNLIKQVKCPWCGRRVSFCKKGNLEKHGTSVGNQCIGVGQPKDKVIEIVLRRSI